MTFVCFVIGCVISISLVVYLIIACELMVKQDYEYEVVNSTLSKQCEQAYVITTSGIVCLCVVVLGVSLCYCCIVK